MAIAASNTPWTAQLTTTTNPLVVSGSATPAGDLLLLHIACNSASATISSIVDTAGNTWTLIDTNLQPGTATVVFAYKCASSASITSITITFSTTVRAAACLASYSGADAAGTLDGSVGKDQSSSATSISPNQTPAVAGSLVVSLTNNNDGTVQFATLTWTGATALPNIGSANGRALTGAFKVVSPAAAQSITWSISPAGAIAGLTYAIKAAAGGTTFTQSLSGSSTPTGALIKQAQKALGGSSTPTGTLVKLTTKLLAGASTPIGSLVKLTTKLLGGSSTPTGALAALKVIVRAFSGSSTPVGTLTKQTSKGLTGSSAPTGTLVKLTTKALVGSSSPSGAIAKLISKLLGGSSTPTGALGTSYQVGNGPVINVATGFGVGIPELDVSGGVATLEVVGALSTLDVSSWLPTLDTSGGSSSLSSGSGVTLGR